MAVNFYLDNRTDKSGDVTIRVSISICGRRYVTSTGCKIPPAKWNAAKQQVKQGCSNGKGITYSAINKQLLKISEHFVAYENKCLIEEHRVDIADIKTEFFKLTLNNRNTPKATKIKQGFFGIYDMFMLEVGRRNQWTLATTKKFRTLKNHLLRWKPQLKFKDLNEKGLTDFVYYLINEGGYINSSVTKLVTFLKTFLRWATKKGYNDEDAYMTYTTRLRHASRPIIFLDWEELMRVYNYEIPANGTTTTLVDANGNEYAKEMHEASAVAKSRDIFCFCCFTGLRYSDAANLRRSNIANGNITITTIKTADTITIELNKYAQAILDKYKDTPLPGNKALPQITNQQMNKALKVLCEFCSINKPITQTYYRGNNRYDYTFAKYELIGTHTGRRTFICNALMLGISPQVIMKWTGHSDYKAMKPYIDITDAAKAQAMNLFNAR